MGFYLIGFVEFGFLPSFGIWAFWDDALVKDNHFRLHYETLPPDFGAGKVTDWYDIGDTKTLRFSAAGRSFARIRSFTESDEFAPGPSEPVPRSPASIRAARSTSSSGDRAASS